MNSETFTLIERPYQEIVDDILTAITGGVVNEPIFFDIKEDLYQLARPARDVRGITGTFSERNADGLLKPTRHTFQKLVDYVFSAEDNAVIWQPGTAKPDDETIFHVDYFLRESRSPLTDLNVGSVTRTLGEAIGREIATVYQQINEAYLAGFIDTAKGKSLELVVSILGIKRKTKEFAVGLVTFFRDQAAGDGNITIAEGTVLSTEKGEATFVTVQLATLQRGQARIDISVRAGDASPGEAGIVKAGAITRLAQSITGISGVTNFEDTVLGAEDETDEQLRTRAKAALKALGKATLAALINAVTEGRAKLTEIFDPNSSPIKRTPPGTVTLMIEAEPERFPSLRAAVEQTRAAGVQATLVARYVFFKPRMRVGVTAGLTAAGKVKVINEIIDAMQKYVDSLGAGEPVEGEKLLKAIAGVKDVNKEQIRFADVITWQSDLGQPGRESLVKLLVDVVKTSLKIDVSTDSDARDKALTTALSNVLSDIEPLVPTGARKPNRSLVQGPAGKSSTDVEIEEGKFRVVAAVDNEKWWVVLDVEPADIVVEEV